MLFGPILALCAWTGLHYSGIVNPILVPTPFSIVQALSNSVVDGMLLQNFIATFVRVITGFTIAAVNGIVLGVLLGYYEKVYDTVEVLIDFFRSLPATALFPLFMLFFGVGNLSKIMIIVFTCSLLVLVNTAYGVKNGSVLRIMVAKSLHASPIQFLFKVIFPDALPHVFAGLRIAVSLALILAVVSEMFFGTTAGLGHRILETQLLYKTSEMYAYILVCGLLGYGLNKIVLHAEHRLVHWSGR